MRVPKAQPIRTATGQQYGQATAQANAQRQIPLPTGTPMPEPLPLNRPSERPDEPITAGLPMGPGPGPEVLGLADASIDEIRALYLKYPSEDLRELIEDADEGIF